MSGSGGQLAFFWQHQESNLDRLHGWGSCCPPWVEYYHTPLLFPASAPSHFLLIENSFFLLKVEFCGKNVVGFIYYEMLMSSKPQRSLHSVSHKFDIYCLPISFQLHLSDPFWALSTYFKIIMTTLNVI